MNALNEVNETTILKKSGVSHWVVTCFFLFLTGLGILNLYSAASSTLFHVQLRHIALGLGVFGLVGWVIPLRTINTYAYILFGLNVLCLLEVIFLGHTAGGAQRWFILGPIRFQPSETAKLAIIILTARYIYTNKTSGYYDLKSLFPLFASVLLVFVLIFEQPDFGTAGLCLLIFLAQIAFVRIYMSFRMIMSIFSATIAGFFIGWAYLLRPYQKLRILNLLNPDMDPSGSGYNSIQSLIAIGSGGLFGKGFLQGTQTQLQFLPARHTDFIFSVFAEEHGFWLGSLVFLSFAALTYLALEIGRVSKDSFLSLTAIGCAALIFIEFTINVAMVLGLFPVVGMPLPFFSYGGSSLLTVCVATGLLVAIDRENRKI